MSRNVVECHGMVTDVTGCYSMLTDVAGSVKGYHRALGDVTGIPRNVLVLKYVDITRSFVFLQNSLVLFKTPTVEGPGHIQTGTVQF